MTSGLDRRTYLKLAGAAVGVTALAGCNGDTSDDGEKTPTSTNEPDTETTEKPTATPEDAPVVRHGIQFDTVRNAVTDLGMDPTGSVAIDDQLDSAHEEGVLIEFPPGKYFVTNQHYWHDGTSRFGIRGLGKSQRAVQFVFPPGNEGAPDPANYRFLDVRSGRDFLLENVTVQQTNDHVTGVGMVFFLEDGLQIHDFELAGFNPMWSYDPGFGIIASITTRAGVGVIRRFTCVGGGVVDEYPHRKSPIGAFAEHRGELRILEAHVEESGSHTAYVSRTNGCVRIEDGLFVNNDNTNIRISGGGHPTKQSWVKNCKVVIDIDTATKLPDGEHYQGSRGIWVESGGENQYGHTNVLLENISVVNRSNAKSLPLLLVEHDHGAVTARNLTLENHVEGTAVIDAHAVDTAIVKKPYGVTLENVTVSSTSEDTVGDAAVHFHRRPHSSLSGVDVELVPGQTIGILIDECDDTKLEDIEVSVDLGQFGSVTGTNRGLVVEDSKGCVLGQATFAVPGKGTEFVNAAVTLVDESKQ